MSLIASQITTKLYIGYLPVTTTETQLGDAFLQHCEVSEVMQSFNQLRIKKGNAQGNFDKFCYGFVTMNLGEKEAKIVMDKIADEHPSWKLKIKQDTPDQQNQKYRQNQYPLPQHQNQHQLQQYPPPPSYMPYQHIPPHMNNPYQPQQLPPQHMGSRHQQQQHFNPNMRQNYNQPYQNNQQQFQNDKGQIFGQKKNKIMVRELWLGGIPQMIDHAEMAKLMSTFGLVEATQIFPKFAFVKFKKAEDAAVAYERAQTIYETFGLNSGFRIAFSDPSRRKEIVSNYYEFQRNASIHPILFLGFPPVTSAFVEINHLLSICQKYGNIVNYFLKKSTHSQMRSYALFTFDQVQSALKAKQELYRRKDLLGEKRVEIALLLKEDSVTKGRDFSHTEQFFTNEANNPTNDNFPKPRQPKGYSQTYSPHLHANNQNPMYYNQNGYPYQQYLPNGAPFMNQAYYYPPSYEGLPKNEGIQGNNHDVFDLLHSVLDDPIEEKKKGPQKKSNEKDEDTNDIISKMLGKDSDPLLNLHSPENEGEIVDNEDQNKQKQPDWSGFLTWRGTRRVGVDGYAITQIDFTDYSINISSLLSNQDVILKDKQNMMVLQPTNTISEPGFKEYLKVLKKHTGVYITKNWLIYLIGKNQLSDQITEIKSTDILIVMQKVHFVQQLKDKVKPCNDQYFEE